MAPVLMDIYEEHLDEASFLWVQWSRALVAPDFSLEDMGSLEERLLAHLDALVLGGEPVATALLVPALDSEDPPRISAALWALLAEPGLLETAGWVTRIQSADAGPRAALGRALSLNDRPDIAEALRPFLKDEDSALQAWALEVLADRGQLPLETRMDLLRHPQAEVVVAALHAGLWLSRDAVSRELPRLLADSRPEVQQAAVLAGMRSGVRAAWEACRAAVDARTRVDRSALVLLALGGDARDLARLVVCTGVESMREDALWALGFSGQVPAADACLEWMGSPAVAALAGEAFSAITGLVWEGAFVEARREGESLPPLAEDLEMDLEPRPEDALPLPAPAAVAGWWREARKGFDRTTRYLRGHPFTLEGLLTELEQGPMRRRRVLALELALRSEGACEVPAGAFSRRQRAGLARARELRGRLLASSFPRMAS